MMFSDIMRLCIRWIAWGLKERNEGADVTIGRLRRAEEQSAKPGWSRRSIRFESHVLSRTVPEHHQHRSGESKCKSTVLEMYDTNQSVGIEALSIKTPTRQRSCISLWSYYHLERERELANEQCL